MLEPDVTLTDYVLTMQNLCFVILLYRKFVPTPWLLLFGSLSVASFLGGTVHGFLPDEFSMAYAIVWRLSLLSISGTTLAGWWIGADLLQNRLIAVWIKKAAILQLVLFIVIITFYSQKFLIAAANYLLATLFLLLVFLHNYLKTRRRWLLWGLISIILTLVGSFIQIAKVSLHPVYFNHNALYHTIQSIALCFLFAAAWHIGTRKNDKDSIRWGFIGYRQPVASAT